MRPHACVAFSVTSGTDGAEVAVLVAERYACLGQGCPLRLESAKQAAAEKVKVIIADAR